MGLDAVYVCVPPFAHHPAETSAEVQVADAGVAVFVEKPLATDLATAEAIAARLRRAGVLTRVGHHWRCAEPVARARELLAHRTIRLVSGTWWDKVPPVSWWLHQARSGGPVVEQAIHLLDLARVLVGEVEVVQASASGTVPGGDVDAAVVALLSFVDGAVGTLGTASVLGAKHRAGIEIVAEGLVVGVGEDWLEVYDGVVSSRAEFDRWTACVAADRAFVDALAGRPVDPLPFAARLRGGPAQPPAGHGCRALGRLGCAGAAPVNRPAPHAQPHAPHHAPPDTDLALVVEEPGRAAVRPVPATDGPVTVRTRYTGLSAGTELSFLTGTNPALTSSFDPELGLFRTDRPGTGYPVERLGYMEVAEVDRRPPTASGSPSATSSP